MTLEIQEQASKLQALLSEVLGNWGTAARHQQRALLGRPIPSFIPAQAAGSGLSLGFQSSEAFALSISKASYKLSAGPTPQN